ncbi:hypothetical protein [Segatella oulorum]|nr:hypothetical protein [Segatella oulorum]
MGRGGACVPARVAPQGRIHRSSPRMIVWKRRYADVRAGTQAPPLRILLEKIARGYLPLRLRLSRLRVCGFVCWLVKTVYSIDHIPQ